MVDAREKFKGEKEKGFHAEKPDYISFFSGEWISEYRQRNGK